MSRMITEIATPRGTVRVRRDYGRWRAASLILVHVLIAAHIVHWKLSGRTLAPLELNEVMYTLEFGIVTAGFLFMIGVTLATAIFGRVFCSWGCHILALQDLCAWILRKLHVRPRGVRSRVLLWVPVVAALYMFAWPQVVRLVRGEPIPQLHLRTDAEGWASFTTENFWRNLPGPAVIILTFAVCGFLIVYVLGTRGFCTYGCPYGAVFRLADRLAPARIRLKKGADCLACGTCTAACTSHVRVHEELNRFGMIADPACLKDLDCVAACPKGNVFYGFGLPSLAKTVRNDTPIRRKYDFAVWEEAVLAVVFLIVIFVYRGLYDLIPFLLSIALGAIAAYATVLTLRLARLRDLQVNRWQLKLGGQFSAAGYLFAAGMAFLALLTIHSAIARYHAVQGHRYAAQALRAQAFDASMARTAIDYFDMAERWGLLQTPRNLVALADLHYQLAGQCFASGRVEEAEGHLRSAIRSGPGHFMAHYDLGALMLKKDQRDQAIAHLRRATQLKPEFADGHYNLALALWMAGSYDDARREIEKALQLNPGDPQTRQLRGLMFAGAEP